MLAIAINYAGTVFRSRLESRWAAFFDLAGWYWEYEPPETGGWIPDFLLIGAKQVTKVEVKPIEWITDALEVTDRSDLAKVKNYLAEATPCDAGAEVLVLGAYPYFNGDGPMLGTFLSMGWGTTTGDDVSWNVWSDPAVLRAGYDPFKLDFHAWDGAWNYRIGGQHDGDHHLLECEVNDVVQMWREAGNLVQWRRDRGPTRV
jgi:hypothetical protein